MRQNEKEYSPDVELAVSFASGGSGSLSEGSTFAPLSALSGTEICRVVDGKLDKREQRALRRREDWRLQWHSYLHHALSNFNFVLKVFLLMAMDLFVFVVLQLKGVSLLLRGIMFFHVLIFLVKCLMVEAEYGSYFPPPALSRLRIYAIAVSATSALAVSLCFVATYMAHSAFAGPIHAEILAQLQRIIPPAYAGLSAQVAEDLVFLRENLFVYLFFSYFFSMIGVMGVMVSSVFFVMKIGVQSFVGAFLALSLSWIVCIFASALFSHSSQSGAYGEVLVLAREHSFLKELVRRALSSSALLRTYLLYAFAMVWTPLSVLDLARDPSSGNGDGSRIPHPRKRIPYELACLVVTLLSAAAGFALVYHYRDSSVLAALRAMEPALPVSTSAAQPLGHRQ